jgi:hypothetical protein
MASRVAFSCFRALTRFGDLPLGSKLLRITCFPYFLARAAFAKDDTPPGARSEAATGCCLGAWRAGRWRGGA